MPFSPSVKPKKKSTKFSFTMVELLAVMTLMGIMLSITVRIMKTDSTKANARAIGSALSYAQAYALSELSFEDRDNDGILDEYVVVEIDASTSKLTIKKIWLADDLSGQDTTIEEKILVFGSKVDTSYTVRFKPNGDPFEFAPFDGKPTTLSSQITITVKDDIDETEQRINIKPFTGKITYY